MRYLPLSALEKEKILKVCGASSFEDLSSAVPSDLRVKGLLDLEPALCESELIEHLKDLAKKNKGASFQSHLGQGVYDHSWPVVIDQIQNRGEFLTAYTPYQPEISQGTLQVIFEFQSMISTLYGMEISNASLYDGATAVVEGVLMAARLKGLKSGTVYISEGTYDRARRVIETYLKPLGFELKTWWADSKTFLSQAQTLESEENVAAVLLQSPNKWGLVEDWAELKKASEILQTKSLAYVSHPHSLALYATPGEHDIDIAVGEGQPLGIPVGFGGPHLGLLTCKKSDVRQMPGRLVGATVDAKGQRAFCVTLSTREQHIRRERATSNICSNQNLMALRAGLYMSLMGPQGLKKVALLSKSKAEYARSEIRELFAKKDPEIKVLEGEAFNEISLLVPQKRALWLDQCLSQAEKAELIPGAVVEVPRPSGFMKTLTLAFTEKHKKQHIDHLIENLCAGVAK